MQLHNVIYGTLCSLHKAMKGNRKACQLYGLKVTIGMTEIILIIGYLIRDIFVAEYAYNGVLDIRKILYSLICIMMLLERLL